MKTLLPVLALSAATLIPNYALAQDPSPTATPPELKVSLVLPESFQIGHHLGYQAYGPRLLNQQLDAHFNVVIENISDHPVCLWENSPKSFWLELTQADGKTLEIRQAPSVGSFSLWGVRLGPGECMVKEVYYITHEQFDAFSHGKPSGHGIWEPEFPFEHGQSKSVSLKAVFEEYPSVDAGSTKPSRGDQATSDPKAPSLWRGKVVSAPRTVRLDYP